MMNVNADGDNTRKEEGDVPLNVKDVEHAARNVLVRARRIRFKWPSPIGEV